MILIIFGILCLCHVCNYITLSIIAIVVGLIEFYLSIIYMKGND